MRSSGPAKSLPYWKGHLTSVTLASLCNVSIFVSNNVSLIRIIIRCACKRQNISFRNRMHIWQSFSEQGAGIPELHFDDDILNIRYRHWHIYSNSWTFCDATAAKRYYIPNLRVQSFVQVSLWTKGLNNICLAPFARVHCDTSTYSSFNHEVLHVGLQLSWRETEATII